MMTSGYVSKTGIKQLDPLLSRGGLLSIMPTVLLLCSGMAFAVFWNAPACLKSCSTRC